MIHPIHCDCGKFKGEIRDTKRTNRCTCYCKDCQAFAHHLERGEDVLDSKGGTNIVQTTPANITITEGKELLSCMRLTNKGIIRWYTDCCKTPIGNTPPDYKLSFLGLVHNCLENQATDLQQSFGPTTMHVHTQSAIGEPKPKTVMSTDMLRIMGRTLKARISSSYKNNPFFTESGEPIVTPKIVTPR